MHKEFKRYLLISFGWLSVFIGAIGAILPVVPTTPFLILALACFSKSSPRFYSMLLNHKRVGSVLTEWEKNKSIRRYIKFRALVLVVISFSASIALSIGRSNLQLILVIIGFAVLWFIYHLKEAEPPEK
ncbi:MAG: uncharacterized membrane protein YbaN (DUF454 family) [Methylophagaceae bacterium]|jgi:uncharacterized membrane protein YbaN (DUF454 family)